MQDHRIEGVGDVDAEDLLSLLDADNMHDVGNSEVGFSCLYVAGHHNGDRNPSAHINRDSLLWRCSACQRAGNLLELVKTGLPHGTTHVEALRWLRENFGETSRKPVGGSLTADLLARLEKARYVPPAQRLPNEAETIGPEGIFHLDWRSDHAAAVYMRDRGFAPEVLEDWNFGFDHWTERVAIPIRDENGILVGFKGRAIDGRKQKYDLLGDKEDRALRYGAGHGWDMHNARKVLFGIDRALKMLKGQRRKRLVLVEGELNVVAAQAAGEAAAAPGTTSITAEQLWLLRANFDELVFLYDSDEAGSGAVWGRTDPDSGKFYPGLVEKISSYFRLFDCPDHEGDPASMAPEEIRSLVAGAKHWLGLAFAP